MMLPFRFVTPMVSGFARAVVIFFFFFKMLSFRSTGHEFESAIGSSLNPLAGKISEDTRKKGKGAKTVASHEWRSFYLSKYDWLKGSHVTKVVWLPNETGYSYCEFATPNTPYYRSFICHCIARAGCLAHFSQLSCHRSFKPLENEYMYFFCFENYRFAILILQSFFPLFFCVKCIRMDLNPYHCHVNTIWWI